MKALRIAGVAVLVLLALAFAIGWRVVARATAPPHPVPVASPAGVGPLAPTRPRACC
jgi:hypothetical protein